MITKFDNKFPPHVWLVRWYEEYQWHFKMVFDKKDLRDKEIACEYVSQDSPFEVEISVITHWIDEEINLP